MQAPAASEDVELTDVAGSRSDIEEEEHSGPTPSQQLRSGTRAVVGLVGPFHQSLQPPQQQPPPQQQGSGGGGGRGLDLHPHSASIPSEEAQAGDGAAGLGPAAAVAAAPVTAAVAVVGRAELEAWRAQVAHAEGLLRCGQVRVCGLAGAVAPRRRGVPCVWP